MSAVMSQTGASFEESLAMLTAITEVTRNASKASRGLVSIGSRLNSVVDESSSNGKALKEIYEGLNIALFDNEGQLRSSYDIFTDLAAIWPTLDKNTQNYIASVQAGTNQFQNFAALMSNFSTATEATETALNSAGSAAEENSRYMEGLEAKTQAVKASFEALSNTVLDSGLISGVLDLGKAFLDLSNNDLGAFLIQAGLITGALWGGTGLIQAMKILPALVNSAAVSFEFLGTAISFGAPQLALIATAIAGIIAVAPALSDWWKTLTNDVEYLNEKIEDANSTLTTNKEQLESLQETPWYDRTPEIEAEIEALEKENAALQENIDSWRKRIYGASVNQEEQGNQYLITNKFGNVVGRGETQQDAINDAIVALKTYTGPATLEGLEELGYSLEMTQEKFAEVSETITNEVAQSLEEFANSTDMSEESLNALGLKINENIQSLEAEANQYKELAENGNELTETQQSIINSYDSLVEMKEKVANLVEAQNNLTDSISLTSSQVETLTNQYPELQSMITQTTEGYQLETQTLVDALIAGEDWAYGMIQSHKELTEVAIAQTEARIQALIAEKESMMATAKVSGESNTPEYWKNFWSKTSDIAHAKTALKELQDLQVSSGGGISIGSGSSGSTSSGSSASSTKKDPIEEQNELFQEQLEILEDRLYFMQKSGATEEEQIAQLQKMQQEVHEQAEWFRSQGLSEDSEYLRSSGKKWIEYYEEIQSISEEAAEKAKEAWEESINAQIEELQDLADKYETAFSYVANKAQEEIDALEEQKDAIQQRYDDEIAALEEQNDELERQIELEEALDALAQAKQSKVMVYKDGRFQYVNDIDAVSEAQSNLDRLEREEALRQEIENLEESRDAEIAAIDTKIEYWEKMKEEWSSAVDQYTEEQDRLIAEQILGIELEGDNWELRLKNLQEYVDEYNSILSQIQSAEDSLSSGGSGESNSSSSGSSGGAVYPVGPGDNGGVTNNDGSWSPYPGGPVYRGGKAASAFASGTLSAPGGLSLVGENGPELRVLGSQDGIIPADVTKNLWAWGKISPSALMSNGMAITIQNLNLPQVTDGPGFVNFMRNNFWRKTLQFQTS